MASDGYNFQQLRTAILALSHAQDWETARKEWKLTGIVEADEPETFMRALPNNRVVHDFERYNRQID